MYGVFLVIVLVVMGGAIAFIGDKLGTKVGKKKLSIFGLRPRHTSIIVTIITGIIITALTLGIVTLSSQNVRVALFGMEKLKQQIHETESNLTQITEQLSMVNAEREKNIAELVKVQEQLAKAQEDSKQALEDLENSKQQVAELEATKIELEQEKNQLEQEKIALDQRIASLNEEQVALEADIDKLQVLTQRLNQGIQFVRQGEIVYRSGELIISGVIDKDNGKEDNAKKLAELFGVANQQILNRLGIKENIDAIWVSKDEFIKTLDKLATAKQDMIVRIVSAGNIVAGEPVRVHMEVYPDKRIYEKNQEVYRQVIQKAAMEDAEETVMDFLKKVNNTATNQGVLPDPLQGTVGVMSGKQFYEIVNKISNSTGDIELIAIAAAPTNASGPLRLQVFVKQLP